MADKTNKTLKATVRKDDFGSAGSRRLLRNGSIPAVIYGKQEPIHIILNAKEFLMKKHNFSESTLIALDVDGTEHTVFVKTYQENLLKGIVNHVDFYEVTAGVLVRTHVRIELTGTPVGCKSGGVLDQVVHELEIECFPRNLPSSIVADVSALDINDALRVEQLTIPEGVKVLGDMSATIATVKAVKEEVAPAADATADATATDAATPAADTASTDKQ